jgi:hypothetical protein
MLLEKGEGKKRRWETGGWRQETGERRQRKREDGFI